MNLPRHCIVCGKELTRRQKSCCSLSCAAIHGNRSARGPDARNWRGGRSLHSGGYIRRYRPDHPRACPAGYCYEHRLKLEEKLGRYLSSQEIVHHRDLNKQNNDLENLKLFNGQGEHFRHHLKKRRLI